MLDLETSLILVLLVAVGVSWGYLLSGTSWSSSRDKQRVLAIVSVIFFILICFALVCIFPTEAILFEAVEVPPWMN